MKKQLDLFEPDSTKQIETKIPIWEKYRDQYPELLTVGDLQKLVSKRLGCSRYQFFNVYRKRFPMNYHGIYHYKKGDKKHSLAEKKITFDDANAIIDEIISSPIQSERENG